MQQVGQGQVRVFLQWRIEFGHLVLQLEPAFAIRHAEDGGHQAFADGPGEMRCLGSGRAGVAFVDQLAVADDEQGVGADALMGGVVAGWEGVVFQGLECWPGDGRAGRPLFGGPVFSLGREAEQQHEKQGQAFGHGGGSWG
ncbi:hypothetical protein D3C72_2075280 [compost metagenome]